MTSERHSMTRRVAQAAALAGGWWASCALAAPNLVANGELDFPQERAVGRVGATGDSAIFEFPGERSFGRVIARGKKAGSQLAENLVVAYTFLTGASGRIYGLVIDTANLKSGGSSSDYDISIWFDLKGTIRSEKEYAYSVVSIPAGGSSSGRPQLQMIAPAVWADGKLVGARTELSWDEDDNSADTAAKRGVVRMPRFERVTGGQFLVLELPRNFSGQFFLQRVSLREIDAGLLTGQKTRMPTPTRYVEIADRLERRLGEVIDTATKSLKQMRSPEGHWGAVRSTALILDALGSLGEDLTEKDMRNAVKWLTEQDPRTVPEVASRLMFIARFGVDDHRQTLAKDLLWLERAQFDDGGWAAVSNDENTDRSVHSDNVNSLYACVALREASYAGFETSRGVWRKAVKYWMDAQTREGGYRAGLDAHGGLGQATTVAMTATGLTGSLISLDMAFAAGSTRCDQYLANRGQIAGLEAGLDWLDRYYGDYYKTLASISEEASQPEKARSSAYGLLKLIEVAGVTRFNNKDIFRTEADELLTFTSPETGLFLGSPSAEAGEVLQALVQGSAPTVFQRIIVGGQPEHEFSRDGYHLVRYLRRARAAPVNWRAATIDQGVDRLVLVPILYLNVVGEMDWEAEDWRKIRDYCFGGGVVLVNIAEDRKDQLAAVERGLEVAFPEYRLQALSPGDPVFSLKHKVEGVSGVRAIGNGLKNFVFLAPTDWSCRLNLYQVKEHAEVFAFVDNLLAYTLDEEDPPRSFANSTWDAGAATIMDMNVAQLEVGGELPAYPDRLGTLDRIMQSGYRLKLREVNAEDSAADPALLWVACAGAKPMTAAQEATVRRHLLGGAYVFAEVLSGEPGWGEAFRSQILRLDDRLRMHKMMSNHPVLTGFIPETQGYDVRVAPLRRSLRDTFAKLPRADLHVIELEGREVGVLCTYDVSAGLGYMHYPGCRGVMPRQCRELATNVVLNALDRATK